MPPKASTSTSATAPATAPAKLSAQEVPAMFQRYRTELQNLAQKIGELESELEEHTLVLQTLHPLLETDPSRPTFRLISGTLVKRTVKDVVPALETNLSGLKEVLESLVKSYKAKEGDFVKFQKEYGISMPGQGAPR